MNQRTDSLWSPEIRPEIQSPRDILQAQAALLREQSGGLLDAEVRTGEDISEDAVYLTFDIVVAALNGARHRLLSARYLVERIYPCHLDAEGLRSAEVAHSDEELRELIRQVLHSSEVRSLAQSLISARRVARSSDANGIAKRHGAHKRLFRQAWNPIEVDDDWHGMVEALYDERAACD